jgi:hypothetical protein
MATARAGRGRCAQSLLAALSALMAVATRRVDRSRRQVTRDLVLDIRSDDGARQQYVLHATTHRLTLPRHPAQRADCTLSFPTARVGLRVLISRRTIGRLVDDMNYGGTRLDGDPVLMLWFHGLTRIVAPIGSTRRPRTPAPVPIRATELDAACGMGGTNPPRAADAGAQSRLAASLGGPRKASQLRAPAGERLPPG